MKNTHTYEPTGGRIGRNNNVSPFTYEGTPKQADQAWLQYIRTYLTDPDAHIRIDGHPDANVRGVVVITQMAGLGGALHEHEDSVTTFKTHTNDPTCNGRYDQEGNRA